MAKITPPEIAAEVRALHGMGKSVRHIQTVTGLSQPTICKITAKLREKGVTKGEYLAKIEQKKEATVIELAAKQGLTKEYVLNKMKQFLDAEKKEIVKGKTGEEQEEHCFIEMVPDYRTQIEGAKMSIDVLGMKHLESKQADAISEFMEIIKDVE